MKNKKCRKYIKATSNIFYEFDPLILDVICSKLYRDGEYKLVSLCQITHSSNDYEIASV